VSSTAGASFTAPTVTAGKCATSRSRSTARRARPRPVARADRVEPRPRAVHRRTVRDLTTRTRRASIATASASARTASSRLEGRDALERIVFAAGEPLDRHALFFTTGQSQQSQLAHGWAARSTRRAPCRRANTRRRTCRALRRRRRLARGAVGRRRRRGRGRGGVRDQHRPAEGDWPDPRSSQPSCPSCNWTAFSSLAAAIGPNGLDFRDGPADDWTFRMDRAGWIVAHSERSANAFHRT
jgi:hypothetical protein